MGCGMKKKEKLIYFVSDILINHYGASRDMYNPNCFHYKNMSFEIDKGYNSAYFNLKYFYKDEYLAQWPVNCRDYISIQLEDIYREYMSNCFSIGASIREIESRFEGKTR